MFRDKTNKILFYYKLNFGTFYQINFFLSFIEKMIEPSQNWMFKNMAKGGCLETKVIKYRFIISFILALFIK